MHWLDEICLSAMSSSRKMWPLQAQQDHRSPSMFIGRLYTKLHFAWKLETAHRTNCHPMRMGKVLLLAVFVDTMLMANKSVRRSIITASIHNQNDRQWC